MEGRYREAVDAHDVAFKLAPDRSSDMATELRFAKLLCLVGAPDACATVLGRAYALGFSDVKAVRTLKDFSNLRQYRPEIYRRLTTASLTPPSFKWGMVWDDAIVKNNSAFDLTNVVVNVNVDKQGKSYPFIMNCKIIKAGQTCEIDNVVSIPNDSYDDMHATFTADQTVR
jgi:hypothetical protein